MTDTNRYTDEALLARSTTAPGPAAEYRILTQVPLEVRQDIVSEAHTLTWSAAVDNAGRHIAGPVELVWIHTHATTSRGKAHHADATSPTEHERSGR